MHSMIKGIAAALLGLCATHATAATDPAAVARARDVLKLQPGAVRASADDAFVARDVVVDADRTEHVRFDRTYRGLPVIGGDMVVHSRDGAFRGASLALRGPLRLSTRPALAADAAIVAAGTQFGSDFAGTPKATLVVYARDRAPMLAWQVDLASERADMTYIVSATDAAIVDRWSNRQHAAANGSAKTLYSGVVPVPTNSVVGGFELRDPRRGGTNTIDASNSRTSGQVYRDTDNAWGTHSVSDVATVAAEAQYGAARTWDYFAAVHGRLGIGGDGKGARSRVHYGFRYGNAFWNNTCFCMTYGDGDGVVVGPLVSLDIAAHEMAHGVNARTANLVYSGESGGLNEANSDIFGTMVEFHANNALDTPDYMIGEEIVIANVSGAPDQRALRFMFNPAADGFSPNCYSPALGELDVHYSSGVANRFFYLLAEGSGPRTYSGVNHQAPTCNGGSLGGVGRLKAGAIWYRALTVYFTSTTDYAAARLATLQAARDLYGPTAPEVTAVNHAWIAVGIR